MKFTIEWSEKKTTSTGKEKLDANLKDETGTITEHATIWGDFPGFAEIMTGHTVEGDLVSKQNGQFLNHTLYPIKPKPATGTGGGMRGVAAAQERKAKFIEEAQDRKSESIAYFNATNSAIQLVSSLPEFRQGCTTSTGLFEIIVRTRDQFLAEWQKYENADYADKHKPF